MIASSGNTLIAGSLNVTAQSTVGALSVGGLASFSGGIVSDTTAFTVGQGTGSIFTEGDLEITGGTILNGGLVMDTDKFIVDDITGNTTIGGTLTATKIFQTVTTFDTSTTPSVTAGNVFLANTAGIVTLTDLDDAANGQQITILGKSDIAHTTINDGGTTPTFYLGGNRQIGQGDVLCLVYVLADDAFYEISYSNN